MSFQLTSEWSEERNQETPLTHSSDEAASFNEFARALLITLSAVLLVGLGTYLIFAGFVASLMALIT